MLLAQFIGIVKEILPKFLSETGYRPYGHVKYGHFDPALVALGTFSANARRIVDHYPQRRYRINVVPTLDVRAASGSLAEAAVELGPPLG